MNPLQLITSIFPENEPTLQRGSISQAVAEFSDCRKALEAFLKGASEAQGWLCCSMPVKTYILTDELALIGEQSELFPLHGEICLGKESRHLRLGGNGLWRVVTLEEQKEGEDTGILRDTFFVATRNNLDTLRYRTFWKSAPSSVSGFSQLQPVRSRFIGF